MTIFKIVFLILMDFSLHILSILQHTVASKSRCCQRRGCDNLFKSTISNIMSHFGFPTIYLWIYCHKFWCYSIRQRSNSNWNFKHRLGEKPEDDWSCICHLSAVCWIRTNLGIHEYEYSMLYIICHPYSNIRKQSWLGHKNGQGQPRVIIWKKPQGMGIQPLGTSSGSILKLLFFPSFCTCSRKIPFVSLFYIIIICCFISYMYI